MLKCEEEILEIADIAFHTGKCDKLIEYYNKYKNIISIEIKDIISNLLDKMLDEEIENMKI